MEEKQEGRKKVRRIFTPSRSLRFCQDIERSKTIKEGLAKHQLVDSVYYKFGVLPMGPGRLPRKSDR
jgi:hypothetical protein